MFVAGETVLFCSLVVIAASIDEFLFFGLSFWLFLIGNALEGIFLDINAMQFLSLSMGQSQNFLFLLQQKAGLAGAVEFSHGRQFRSLVPG